MLLLRCITFYSPYIQSLFNFSAFLIFPLQGRISLLFSLTFLPRAELRMRNGSAQDFSRHAAHEMKIVVIVVGSNNCALGSNKTTARREIQLRTKPKFCVGAATKLKPKSFARISPFHLRRRSRRWQRRSSSSTRREQTARERERVPERARWQHVCCQQHVDKQQTTRRDLFLCFYWSRFLAVELRLLQGGSRRRRRWVYSLGNNL